MKLEGHAIECRINAEDPSRDFAPSPGRIERWHVDGDGVGIRVDTHVETGYEVPPFYDSLLCKVIAHGDTRKAACDRLVSALDTLRCDGVTTTVPMHLSVLKSKAFRRNDYDVSVIPGWSP